ncbi:MAG: rsxB 1, partial [Sporomusa sp.]|nr:rsxB 1 [Sporomusa sp.]
MWCEALGDYYHSVRLDSDRCRGCVNCIKHCPTEAIRIRCGKAQITQERCIDCGECIRRCPNHAKAAVTDSLQDIQRYKYNIALPAPSLYAQFNADIPIESILGALLELGFDEVFEVALAAEFVSLGIKEYLASSDIKRPAISSACPAVVRLIQVNFPELIDHLIPIDAPVDVAARVARIEASRKLQYLPEEVGVWFITPCPAKMTAARQPLGLKKSNVTGAIGISNIYADLLKALSVQPIKRSERRASRVGIGWGVSGGENVAVEVSNSLVIDEISKVSDVLEQIS